MSDQDDRTPAQQFADHTTGASREQPQAPISQPINPRTDGIDSLHQRTETGQ